jgi:tRNA G46 methylase TrmB
MNRNPHPRWTILPMASATDAGSAAGDAETKQEILIAGCGSGQHVFQVAQCSPAAQVLAIDVSLPRLAHAMRKMREAGLRNVDYAQADILKLTTLDHSFDRTEAVGGHSKMPAADFARL